MIGDLQNLSEPLILPSPPLPSPPSFYLSHHPCNFLAGPVPEKKPIVKAVLEPGNITKVRTPITPLAGPGPPPATIEKLPEQPLVKQVHTVQPIKPAENKREKSKPAKQVLVVILVVVGR